MLVHQVYTASEQEADVHWAAVIATTYLADLCIKWIFNFFSTSLSVAQIDHSLTAYASLQVLD